MFAKAWRTTRGTRGAVRELPVAPPPDRPAPRQRPPRPVPARPRRPSRPPPASSHALASCKGRPRFARILRPANVRRRACARSFVARCTRGPRRRGSVAWRLRGNPCRRRGRGVRTRRGLGGSAWARMARQGSCAVPIGGKRRPFAVLLATWSQSFSIERQRSSTRAACPRRATTVGHHACCTSETGNDRRAPLHRASLSSSSGEALSDARPSSTASGGGLLQRHGLQP